MTDDRDETTNFVYAGELEFFVLALGQLVSRNCELIWFEKEFAAFEINAANLKQWIELTGENI